MNGQWQEIRSLGKTLPEDRKQHVMVLLTRMIHQRLTASRLKSTEGAARKKPERPGR